MENAIIVIILLCIVSSIVYYLYKAKKRGESCIGCPYARECSAKHKAACAEPRQTKE